MIAISISTILLDQLLILTFSKRKKRILLISWPIITDTIRSVGELLLIMVAFVAGSALLGRVFALLLT